jgi:predicted DNA-binding transcriptional regulator AlpA
MPASQPPYKLGRKIALYDDDEVDAWIVARKAAV